MYELLNGSARLSGALQRAASDPARVKALANILYYDPEQLPQDIQALADFRERFISLEAAEGYAIAASCDAGIRGAKAAAFMDALEAAFENMTATDAEAETEAYNSRHE